MRTSRVSAETAKVIAALAPRRSTRSMRTSTSANSANVEIKADVATSSPISSPLSSPVEDPLPYVPHVNLFRKRKFEEEEEEGSTTKSEIEAKVDNIYPRKARRQPAKRTKGPNGDVKIEPPANWEKIWSITHEMRKRNLAPVDTMGCESAAEESRSPLDKRFQTLIALMLSSQTKDTTTFAAMRNMQDNMPGGFTLSSVLKIAPEELNALICKVGFHNNKTKYIKATAEILARDFKGDIPDTIDGLISLPGVGPKMAYLCMSSAWERDEGIGVDVHVHRITNLWHWHPKPTRTPEETRLTLQEWLPKEKWHAINHLLVGFGQTICLPVGRKCGDCDLAKEGLCPSAVVPKVVKKRVKVERHDEEAVKTEVLTETRIKLEAVDENVPPLEMRNVGEAVVADIEGT